MKAEDRDDEPGVLAPPEAFTDMRGTAADRARFGMPTPPEQTGPASAAVARRITKSCADVPAEYRHIQENPGFHAETAVMETRYEFMTIEVTPGAIAVRYGSGTFERQAVYRTSAEARERFEVDGLNAALKARGWNPRRILDESTTALEDGQVLTITPIAGSIRGRHPDRSCAPAP